MFRPGNPRGNPHRARGAAFHCARPPGAGFTLLEFMISMGLLTWVLVFVYGAFAQISTGALSLRDEMTERQELRLLMRMVMDDLQSVQWLDQYYAKGVGHDTGIEAETVYEGGKEFSQLNFHAAIPSRFHRTVEAYRDPGLHEVGYKVRPADPDLAEGDGLVLERREDFYIDNDMKNGGLTVTVAVGITDFLVEFLPPDADPNALRETWEDRWNSSTRSSKTRIPMAVRLTLGREDAKGKSYREVLEVNLYEGMKL